MDDIAVKADSISKLYRIGIQEQMHESLGAAFIDFIKSPINNYRKYRSLYRFDDVANSEQDSNSSDIIWALKDVSFEVPRGEALAVIGSNGAGKSTLLKILARVTHPTSGRVEINGRISSLLEVGTGFHPDLTGRENIYLNATILGMRKAEVDRKFDEIVDFSGVERFLDTPVKRYSSGMRVRLAFAVAAYLEPEILIIDEVLAVGDAAFQAKCLGKMEDVAKGGRTVLFVSHNMAAVTNLCPRAILLKEGRIVAVGPSGDVVNDYLTGVAEHSETRLLDRIDRQGDGELKATDIQVLDSRGSVLQYPQSGQDVVIRLHYKSFVNKKHTDCRVSILIMKQEQKFILLSTELVDTRSLELSNEGYIDFIIPDLPLHGGTYSLVSFIESKQVIKDWVNGAAALSVVDGDYYGTGRLYPDKAGGKTVLVRFGWKQQTT